MTSAESGSLNQSARRIEGIILVDKDKIITAVNILLEALGDDPSREGLVETPSRVSKMYSDLFSGLSEDPSEVLNTGFDEEHNGLVTLQDLPFSSMCEHHLLPFIGTATISYLPNGRILGASKLGRALDILSKRPQLQERITSQLAELIHSTLRPKGVSVTLSAEHMWMSIRGIKKPGTRLVTSIQKGVLKNQS